MLQNLMMHTSCNMFLINMLHKRSLDNNHHNNDEMKFINATKSSSLSLLLAIVQVQYTIMTISWVGIPLKESKSIKYLRVYLTNDLKKRHAYRIHFTESAESLRANNKKVHDAPKKVKPLAYSLVMQTHIRVRIRGLESFI